MSRYDHLLLPTLMLFAASCSSKSPEDALEDAHKAWITALTSGDVDAISAFHTADAMLLPDNREVVRGRVSVVADFEAGLAQADKNLTLKVANEEAVVDGNLGYTLGTYTVTDALGNQIARGKYVEIWRKQDGRWRLSRDISNSSLPAAAEADEEQ